MPSDVLVYFIEQPLRTKEKFSRKGSRRREEETGERGQAGPFLCSIITTIAGATPDVRQAACQVPCMQDHR